MRRPFAAVVLYGGWLLLTNPDPQRPDTPLGEWKTVDDYDTAYECEAKRRAEMKDAADDEAKKGRAAPPAVLELRYRCERRERVPKAR